MNYFIFQGPIEEKGVTGLQKIFNVHNSNIHRQIYHHSLAPEYPRKEVDEKKDFEIAIDEKPISIIVNEFELKEG